MIGVPKLAVFAHNVSVSTNVTASRVHGRVWHRPGIGACLLDVASESRQVLQKVATLMSSPEMRGRKFRVEGHTDDIPTDPQGEWETNWELSADRAVNVLHYLVDFGVDENQCQVAGFADTVPLASNETREGRAYNRRVDIVLLTEGHL